MREEIRVWDPAVRIFHWSLVAAFTIAYLSGEEEGGLHIWSGYAVLGLISFRLLWGFVGTKYARFRDFVRSPAAVFAYLKGLAGGTPQHFTGHNPASGWMVLALLASLFVVTLSGLKVYGLEGHGPLAGVESTVVPVAAARADSDGYEAREVEDREHDGHGGDGHEDSEAEEFWEEIHEAASNFMLFLIVVHVLGVIVSGRLHRENLVRAMITGRKPARD